MLIFAPEDEQEIAQLPLVTSLHRIDNEVMAYIHSAPRGIPMPVSDAWIEAVAGYEGGAKVVLVLQPLPRDIDTTFVPRAEGVTGDDLPPWIPALIAQQLRTATRDVPVSAGTGVMDIQISLDHPHDVEHWAERIFGPDSSVQPPTL
ncbi:MULTISPECIES: hypothetical protein [unclassified Crossiella]|uniref:hypothetical protein n=1 Tax=unclassified Crossiella TaxID=2620835 RepID=UPI001FFE695E|nr:MULTISPECIES: hypothetical protein [unclassified Crossiella]MCK2245287.1 hypothetical protein [Crossiella sp. S99.2]MCK2258939.1 hypothetical protein [Crossiella sp. S99.1]